MVTLDLFSQTWRHTRLPNVRNKLLVWLVALIFSLCRQCWDYICTNVKTHYSRVPPPHCILVILTHTLEFHSLKKTIKNILGFPRLFAFWATCRICGCSKLGLAQLSGVRKKKLVLHIFQPPLTPPHPLHHWDGALFFFFFFNHPRVTLLGAHYITWYGVYPWKLHWIPQSPLAGTQLDMSVLATAAIVKPFSSNT